MTNAERDNRIINLENMVSELLAIIKSGCFPISVAASISPCPYTLYSWLEEWYTTYKVPKLKPTSLKSLRICIDKHIKTHLADKPLNELTDIDIQKALNKIPTSRMKKYTYDVYNAALKQAYKSKLIADNPLNGVESIGHKRKNGNALTHEQQRKFIKILDGHKLRPLYLFYLMTGTRRQEALDLKWTDVNFKAKQIHIHGTKAANSDRIIPLFPQVAELLKSVPRDGEYIFPYSGNLVHCQFTRLKAKYKLPYRIHDLRHTFATRCIENGISMKIVQKWLGHAKLDTTANIYTHVQSDFETEEIKKYDPKLTLA